MEKVRKLVPTHDEVIRVLSKTHPHIAKMIEECNRKKECWGDLIIRVQHEFSPHDVATCFSRLYLNGWGELVIKTWCPLTDYIWERFEKAVNLQGEYSKYTEADKRNRKGTVYGSIILFQDLWRRTRREWMRRWSVKSEADSMFFTNIIVYLEKVAEQEKRHASNNG